jgi:hypothetical protein
MKDPVDAIFPKNGELGSLGPRFKDYLNRLRETRKALMALTYNGSISDVIEFVPDSWKEADPAAIELAASEFQKAFQSNIAGRELEKKPFAPEKQDFVGRWQEARAAAKASETYLAQFGHSFSAITATPSEINQYKAIYALSLANILKLYPEYAEHPAHEQRVLDAAALSTRLNMDRPEVQAFFTPDKKAEKVQYEASIYATSYIDSYMKVVVRSGEASPTSPSQPGVVMNMASQKLRQMAFVRNSPILTRFLRGAEAFAPAEGYELGRTALLDRSVPGWYLFKKANRRYYQNALTNATAVYWFNYFVFGLNLSASLWTLSLVAGWTIGAPGQFLNRLFANQGWAPSGKLSMTALFAVIYTWATFWGELPVQIFAGDFKHGFDFLFRDHFAASVSASTALFLGYQIATNRDRVGPSLARTSERLKNLYSETIDKCRAGLGALGFRK